MTWTFGDSFDFYSAVSDGFLGYWDCGSGVGAITLVAGRFAGSQAIQMSATANIAYTKTSGVNDAIHHFICAVRQTAALSGTNLGLYLELLDGTTAQCSVVFRSDGAMLLTSGAPNGTVLATYTGAISAQNTWTAFEIEIVVATGATGSISVKKNGNTGAADFSLGSLVTAGGATHSYANKLTLGMQAATVAAQQIDDLLWRSDASSVAWLGDVRAYQVLPSSDASVQFTGSPNPATVSISTASSTLSKTSGNGIIVAFTASQTGTIATATIAISTGGTGNLKAAIYDATHTTSLGASNAIVNPTAAVLTFTFATPVSVTRGTSYYFAVDTDFTIVYAVTGGSTGFAMTTAYASFPATSPTIGAASQAPVVVVNITPLNSSLVGEAQEDSGTTYVYDSTVGHSDLYNTAGLGTTPASIIMVTTKGLAQKSDAGSRVGQIQLKSGSTTVQTSNLSALSTSFLWQYRQDLTDPNTGSAWTPVAVNAAQIGPVVVS